jgi:GNAT superfamily N-acetyltransferase
VLVIRMLEPSEWQALRKLRLRALKDSPHAFGSTYEREIAFDEVAWSQRFERTAWFAADQGDDLCGMSAGMYAHDDPPHARELVSMWVAPEVRGTGVGGSLINAVKAWASDEGATELYLWVAADNDQAERFYGRFGFKRTGHRAPLRDNAEMLQLALQL